VTFENLNLNTPLLKAIDGLGFECPTPIQAKVFAPVMSGKDLVGIAQTGTGKTLAYLMPILKQLKYSEQKHPRVLIVVPTRELVVQVIGEIENLAKYMNIRYAGIYGGANINTQKQIVYNGLDILVATPGRLMDMHMTGILRLKSVQKFVIDEVDEMLKQGFRPQIMSILEILPQKRQNMMFSATLTSEVDQLINDYFFNPQKIEIAPHGTPLDSIVQEAYHVPNFSTKLNLLEHLLKTNEEMAKVLVFVSTKKLADRLFEQLDKRLPEISGVIHSNKGQNTRFNVLEKFETGGIKILISTDILARGLDIHDVSHVVNFDTPAVPGDYLHRIGRTGRAEKDGVAITFINRAEQESIKAIETLMNKAIPLFPIPENVEISTIYTEEERPDYGDKDYFKAPTLKNSKGAFHEKKDKNKKQNSKVFDKNKSKTYGKMKRR
jgi:ATP-dependent RNA helicase RhlE